MLPAENKERRNAQQIRDQVEQKQQNRQYLNNANTSIWCRENRDARHYINKYNTQQYQLHAATYITG